MPCVPDSLGSSLSSSSLSRLSPIAWRSRIVAAFACIAVLTLQACGESDQQKAEREVCDAKTEVAAGVEGLAGQTLATVSISQLEADTKRVGSGLQKLTNAEGKLSEPRKAQVKQATSTLSAELGQIAESLKSLSLTDVRSKLSAATQKLLESYKRALAPVSC